MREYAYQCKDYSLLTPLFKKVFVNPVINHLPWGLPANIITIVSNLFFYFALYLSFDTDIVGRFTFLLIPVLLLAYLIGDHLDGAQAKRTKTGSALGEFCDHYLDAFNNGILMLILFNLFGTNDMYLIAVVLITSYCAHVIVFYEQFKTGWLIFEKMGSLEGVLLSILLIAAAFFEPIETSYTTPLIYQFTFFDVLLVFIALGAVATFIKTLQRTPNVRYSIWIYVVSLLIIAFTGIHLFNKAGITLIVTLYSSLYLGKIMVGHLIDGVERSPGLFTPLFLIIITLMPGFYSGNSLLILAIYLIANIALLVYRTFQALGQYWVWVNPRLENEES